MSTNVELEIQNLLNEIEDLDVVSDRLINFLESSPTNLTSANISAVALFLNHAGRSQKLLQFVLRNIENKNFVIPWPHFLEALSKVTAPLDEKTRLALLDGIREDQAEESAARSLSFSKNLPELQEHRQNRKYRFHKEYLANKRTLLEQLYTLRTQQLFEQEKILLQRLQRLYPGDDDVAQEVGEHRQRHALEILQKRAPRIRAPKTEDLAPSDPEVESALETLLLSLQEHATQIPELAFDFAIVAAMLERYDVALSLLSHAENSPSVDWLRLELLMRCRRFVELLSELTQVELKYAHEPETFFATAYLRAQALWGLGQKHNAIEVMEGLLSSRPHYRAASAILSLWRNP